MTVEKPKTELIRALLESRSAIGASVWELLWLLGLADAGRQVSMNTMAVDLGKKRRSVVRNIRRLEQHKIIERESVAGQAHKYTVRLAGGKANV